MDSDQQARRFAGSHHGLIDRSTARRVGLTDRQIRTRVRAGSWQVVRPGVYSLSEPRDPIARTLLAASWDVGAPVSAKSAGWLLRMLDAAPQRPQLLTGPTGAHRFDDLDVRRSIDLRSSDLTTVRGIRTTNGVRTLLDLAAELPRAELEAALDRGLRLGVVTSDRLAGRLSSLSRSGRPGIVLARSVLSDLDRDLALLDSDLESMMLRLLARAGVPAPVPQFGVQFEGRRYRIDLAYPDVRLAIELDGFAVHGRRSSFEDDRRRQNDLVLLGWRVLRFTWRQLCREPDRIVEQIRALLGPVGRLPTGSVGRK